MAEQIPAVPSEAHPVQGEKSIAPWILSLTLLLFTLLLNAAVGPVSIPLRELVRILLGRIAWLDIDPTWSRTFETILFQIRLPNAALIAITGMALGGSGAAYQGLFRNPLADPYIIGVASGAGLGA
ncbi:MAG: iron chelate uptake ABC transporter family permease subunit, partial [Anaerolineales bacterium]